jgi:hypothetical protein
MPPKSKQQPPSEQEIKAEIARRKAIWRQLQPIAQKVLQEYKEKARQHGVWVDDWISISSDHMIIFCDANPEPKKAAHAWISLYKNGQIKIRYRDEVYDYPNFSDDAPQNFAEQVGEMLQRRLKDYLKYGM